MHTASGSFCFPPVSIQFIRSSDLLQLPLQLLGDPSERVPPVPIPNTEVKPLSPDGTARASVWESRKSPKLILKSPVPTRTGLFLVCGRTLEVVIAFTRDTAIAATALIGIVDPHAEVDHAAHILQACVARHGLVLEVEQRDIHRPVRHIDAAHGIARAAHAEGFHDFDENDICPVSGFVLRLAGLRLESRELVLRMLSLGGRTPDPRVTTHRIAGDHDAAARTIIEGADLVIGALGYRPRCVPPRRWT